MRRDISVAILMGFVIGAIVALTATNLPKIIKEGIKISKTKVLPSATPAPVKSTAQNLEFTIDSPKDETVSDDKTINLTGSTKAGQTVLIETGTDQQVTQPDTSGKFTSKLDLTEGVNTIFVTVYDADRNSNSKTINVYYTTEKL